MLNSLLYRGRHTVPAALCALLSVTVNPAFAQGSTSLPVNPNLSTLLQPPPVLTPENVGLLNGYTTPAPVPPPSTIIGVAMPGKAIDIGASANGSVWVIGIGDFSIWEWNSKAFIKMPGIGAGNIANRIAVSPEGIPWVVDRAGGIRYFDPKTRLWNKVTGTAADIAIGSEGTMWIVTPTGVVQKWNGSTFEPGVTIADGGARRIAVDPFGMPWLISPASGYRLKNGAFEPFAMKGYDIAIGGDGAVWVPNLEAGGGGRLQWWNGVKTVMFEGAKAAHLAVDGLGSGLMVGADQSIYRVKLPGPVTMMNGIRSEQWNSIQVQGKMLCSGRDLPNDCGRAIASFVGKHEVKMNCPSGFYDPIWGGTCWKCPDDDGNGGWIRSLDAVNSSSACWRAPKEALTAATKVKSPSLSWNCPEGSFWDGISPDGAGGSCWTCPSDYPRRTGFAVDSAKACASSANETKPATMLSYFGCPEPNRDTLGFTGMKQPGRPFLDVGAGGCYSCPVVAKDGTFLISLRNGVALYSQDAETDTPYANTRDLKQGCDVSFRYQPSPFHQPGLTAMGGAIEVINEARLFEYPDLMTGMLYALADGRDLTGAAATTYVTEAWKQLANDPINSEALRSVAFLLMQGAARKDATLRTPSEVRMLESFSRYITARRTYFAQQGLDMYDAWKANSDAFQASIAKSTYHQMFSYGVVPLDFKGTMLAIAGTLGTAGLTTAGLAAAFNNRMATLDGSLDALDGVWGENSKPTTTKPVETATRSLRLSRPPSTNASSLTKVISAVRGMSAGATFVLAGTIVAEIALGVLLGIAAQQFVAIETARPELLVLLENAKTPVDAATLMSTTDGLAQALLYWGQAMDMRENTVSGLSVMAAEGKKWAEARKYLRPKGI